MSKTCAYCKSADNKLSREHIWPKCIIERVPDYSARYSERANKVFSGDQVVSDVCSQCNSGPLSELDSYICHLFDMYFQFFPEAGQSVDFKYDWSLLGRWLLKVSYNSARVSRIDNKVLSHFADVIHGEDSRPPDLAIFLDLVEPSYMENVRKSGVIELKRILPTMTRVCRINIPNITLKHYIVRMVAINAFYFYLAIPTHPYSEVHQELQHIVDFFSLMACLDPDENMIKAKTTKLTSDTMIRPHIEMNRNLYEEYLENQ